MEGKLNVEFFAVENSDFQRKMQKGKFKGTKKMEQYPQTIH